MQTETIFNTKISECKWTVEISDRETSFERSTRTGKILFYTSDPDFYSYIESILVKCKAELEHADSYGLLFYIDNKHISKLLKAYKEFYKSEPIIND